MKKIVLVMMVVCTLLFAAACGKECDICGEKGRGKTEEVFGKEVFVCNDCIEDMEKLGNMFN